MADVKKAVKAILERVNTAKKAVALKGKEREEYLKTLDEAYGPVQQRQKLTGHTADMYHGSPSPLEGDKIALNKAGKTTGVNTANSFAVTDSPRLASEYADFGIDSGNVVTPLKVNLENVEIRDAKNKQIKNSIRSAQVEDATQKGKSGVLYKNLIDDPNEAVQSSENIAFITKPSTIRSKFAAFDPRFKDSDLIMAANKGKKSTVETGLNALSIPQKILMRKTAEAMGIDLGAETGEASEDADKASEAIVEKAAQKLGIPEGSQLGALGKAAAKTALDVAYDPLSAIPVAKVAKAAKSSSALSKILSKLGIVAKKPKLPTMAEREKAVLRQKWEDIVAGEKVADLKNARAAAKWEKLSDAEKEELFRKQYFGEGDERLMAEARARFEEGKKYKIRRPADTTKLTEAEELAQRQIDLNKERMARMAEPPKELEDTQPLVDVAKLLKKKKK